jgi:nanoRNase/pAp phosphatase (c-di-AMP/oligoRNAs hydrolase)
MVHQSLESLLGAVKDVDRVLILTHNNPDPDAIAAAVGLRHLLAETLRVEIRIGYKGFIGRAENKALVRYLDNPLRLLTEVDMQWAEALALVDTQPGAGNSPLPGKSPLAIVIDHHPRRKASAGARFADIRHDVGSTSTILTEYLRAADIKLTALLATALFYGIKTDTMGLGRSTSQADVEAYFHLQPLIDMDRMADIEGAQVSTAYFRSIDKALRAALVYDDVVVAYIGRIVYADLTAEIADLLLRLRGIQWVICMGLYHEDIILSVRTRNQQGGAGLLAKDIVGKQGLAGGHGMMAGGHVRLDDQKPRQAAFELGQRALRHLNVSTQIGGRPLI